MVSSREIETGFQKSRWHLPRLRRTT